MFVRGEKNEPSKAENLRIIGSPLSVDAAFRLEPTNLDVRVKWHLLARMIPPVENTFNLAVLGQVAFDAGAKRLLLPMASVKDIRTIPGELFAKFQTGFYADPVDAVFKALGVQ